MTRLVAGGLTFILLGAAGAAAQADPSSEQVVVRVGKTKVSVGDLQRRLRKISPFQLRMYGNGDDAIRHAFLDKVLLPELLYAEGARASGRDKLLDVQAQERDLLKTALLIDLRDEILKNAKIDPKEILAYYRGHAKRYHSPPRYSIWRILVPTKEQALKVLREAQKDPTPKTWKKLAGEHSIDKATALRGGNLGFLKPDGHSLNGKVSVAIELMKAAMKVRDGEIVPEPIAEGSHFAVVWRRGSLPGIDRPLEKERSNIARVLARKKIHQRREKLLKELEGRYVTSKNLDATSLVEVSAGGKIVLAKKPGREQRGQPARENPSSTKQ